MPDLDFALRLSAPESTLAVGGLLLLMLGAFLGEKSARLISILSVAVLVAATAVTVTGPLGMAFNGAYVADPLAVYGKTQALEGPVPDGLLILEFPDADAARAWYDSP